MENTDQNSFTLARLVALATAVVTVAGLVLQLVLIIQTFATQGQDWAAAIWRYLGFFTILMNIATAVTSLALALHAPKFMLSPVVRLAVATSIITVGLVYSFALRATWQPEGWQALADHLLHDAAPPLFALTWLAAGHGSLKWRDAVWAITPGFAYFIYAMLRGANDGWYGYWFLDPSVLPTAQMAISIVVLLAVFGCMALVLILLDKVLARRSAVKA